MVAERLMAPPARTAVPQRLAIIHDDAELIEVLRDIFSDAHQASTQNSGPSLVRHMDATERATLALRVITVSARSALSKARSVAEGRQIVDRTDDLLADLEAVVGRDDRGGKLLRDIKLERARLQR